MAESAFLSDNTGGAGLTHFDTNLKRIYDKKSLRDLNLDLSTYSDSYIYSKMQL